MTRPWRTLRYRGVRLFIAATVIACLASCQDSRQQSSDSNDDELVFASALSLTERFSRHELLPTTLLEQLQQRINRIDRSGPQLRSIIALNPNAMRQAEASATRHAQSAALGPLDGLPVLIKDNIETADPLPTTAGSMALSNNITGRDNPAIANIRAAGGVILGKANLSEWANFRSSHSVSGWSALGGQVKNPHILDRSPCGSSSGSAVAVAAGLVPLAIGTETNGSIICPAQVNGIVGFKPTLGLVSAEHIVPISPSQDTAGPMARSVADAALLLDAMTANRHNFTQQLPGASLRGVRIGVLSYSLSDSAHVQARFGAALIQLEKAGAELIAIEAFAAPDPAARALSRAVLEWEFKASINAYLASSPADIPVRSLGQLIDWNRATAQAELTIFDQSIFLAAQSRSDLSDPDYVAARKRLKSHAGRDGIDRLLRDYRVDLLVAPSGPVAPPYDHINGDNWPQWAGAGYLAAVAGYPHLTVPMGTARSMPLGLSFMAGEGMDTQVLQAGHVFEHIQGAGPRPRYLATASDQQALASTVTGVGTKTDLH